MLLAVVLAVLAPSCCALQSFTRSDFLHLTRNGDQLYVGAKNRIYMLNTQLNGVQEVETGPKYDNVECLVPLSEDCEAGKILTDNYNKILVVDSVSEKLVTCGSVYQGTCELRNLNDISEFEEFRQYMNQAVAANSQESSTVAFIAMNNLYVGTTLINHNRFVNRALDVPSFSIRGIYPNSVPFELARPGTPFIPDKSALFYKQEEAEKVEFVAGFNSSGYNYFLFNIELNNKESSYIAQICESDNLFESYVEIPIECGATFKYIHAAIATTTEAGEQIIAATFTNTTTQSGRHSVFCVFKLSDVRRRVASNLQQCFKGGVQRGLHFDKISPQECHQESYTVPDDFCTENTKNNPYSGSTAITSEPIITSDKLMTSVAVSSASGSDVAFIGMSTGHVKKIFLEPREDGQLIEEIVIDEGSPILKDMLMTDDENHIFAMTTNSLYKVPTHDCGRKTTCEECLSMGDPYCGWCSLENKCSVRSECGNSNLAKRWLTFEAWSCIADSFEKREFSTQDGQQTITITIDELPSETVSNKYQCVLNGKAIDAMVNSENEISCRIQSSDMPTIPTGEDNVEQDIGIKSTETGVTFLQNTITFYNCSVHNECTRCAKSNWGCEWCVHSHECVSQQASCSSDSDQVSHSDNCPRMLHTSEILIANNVATTFTLRAANLAVPKSGQSGYKCHVILGSPEQIVDATRVSASELRCNEHTYSYEPLSGKETASIQIKWNGHFEVEDHAVVQAVVYKCEVMGADCSACSSLGETEEFKYGCWWCDGQCAFKEWCEQERLERQLTCPKPNLEMISPLNGPKEGGTFLTITGSNLGRHRPQVDNSVTIGGKPCPVTDYKTSMMIVCKVPEGDTDSQISVTISENTIAWEEPFVYKDPKPTRFEPNIGPVSGGTILTIMGQNLKTGANIELIIGDIMSNVTCDIDLESSTDQEMFCTTSSVAAMNGLTRVTYPQNGVVFMRFDGVERDLNNDQEFEYVLDPIITAIEPLLAFESGGRTLTVTGENLHSVKKPKIFIMDSSGRKSNKTDCFKDSEKKMICPSPRASLSLRRKRESNSMKNYQLGLDMDGVQSVKNLSNFLVNSKLMITKDPEYYEFMHKKREYRGEALKLNGTNLNLGCTADDVRVIIGTQRCEVKSLGLTQLLCTPPDKQPEGYPRKESLPIVTVQVGNLNFELGSLEYVSGGGMSEYLIIGVAVVGGILITVIIVILIVYKRKSTEAERQYKKMQIQLDNLESNVRNECKQAFAELQTEVSDFTSDLNVIGIPFWDYKAYTFKVLFPSHSDHPILHPDPKTYTKYGGYEEGFHQFNQLMNSKHFLLIFIRTLEQQKNFGIRDKAVVASLLMIVLQDKMEYATEILKALLNELVDKSVEKKHPKLMLRRTESVVEKLVTNWLSLCMYTYLKKHAGKTLFMLYKAIKHQTEKGPIDGITSEARYSLSEDRLLREKIEPKALTILLRSDNDDGREPVSCKVLDCDTITQAKEKALDAIYMNTPHSKRPSVYDVDLMWQSGQRGHLPLKDEDVTTQVHSGWKRINTLMHYHVPDGANMSLVQSTTKNDMVREMHGMIEITSGSSLSAITPIITMEEGVKVFHLHKQDDNQNAPRSGGQKVISEIFLTRLLATKGTLQQYVDDLFSTILRADSTLTTAVKYLFDFLDNAARRHNIVDPEVVHTWKSNSLPLRFWVNIVKNPEFVFDVSKSHIVDSCLSVIAQTFMDSCSLSEHRLGKDSPSSKLLFAKDIPRYRKQVSQYYRNVQEMPPVTDRDMTQAMTELSMTNVTDFNVSVALKELYKYSMQYSFELIEALDEDPSARKMHLANRFEQVQNIIEGTQYY